jgi:hypothetical protein
MHSNAVLQLCCLADGAMKDAVSECLLNNSARAGTPVSSKINPIFFVIGLSGFTIASVGALLLIQ